MASLVNLTDEQRELSERARQFVDEVLIPHEVAAERSGGHLPAEVVAGIKEAAVKARLNGGRHSVDHGGQGWSAVDYVLVHEQLGRNTNGLWWWIPDAYNVLSAGTPEQIERYLVPSLTGEATVSYAVTEEHAGSDPSAIRTTARPDGDGWVIDGEKWFVTSGDVAAAHIVVANAEGHGPTLFIVDASSVGVETVDDPPFTHTFPHGHPDDPAHRRTGRVGGAARWPRSGRRAAAVLVRGGAPGHRRALRRGHDPLAGGGDGVDLDPRTGRPSHPGLPGRVVSRSRIRRRTRRPPGCSPSRWRRCSTRERIGRSCTRRRRWPNCSPVRRPIGAPIGSSRPSVAEVSCVRSRPSGSCGSYGSTASGRARARSSA